MIFLDIFKKHNKLQKKDKIMDKVKDIISMQDNITDPNGSYTGVPQNPHDKPVQDADDL